MIIIIHVLINHASVFDEFFVTELNITPVMRASRFLNKPNALQNRIYSPVQRSAAVAPGGGVVVR